MDQEMTKKQKALYLTIKDFIKVNGYAPTIREINTITGIKSTSTTFSKLFQLRKKGFITYIDGKARTIKILK